MRKFIYGLLALVIAATGMAYADSIITGSKPFTFIPGTTISSSQVNADFDYIINQVNTNAAKNGANSSITSLLGLTTPINPTQGGSATFIATTVGGTANAITVSATTPPISGYTLSQKHFIVLTATNTNTASVTLNVNTTGPGNIFKKTFGGLIALQGGEIVASSPQLFYYDGTNYILLSDPQGFGNQVSIASAATTDLGTSSSHNILITGNTGITSFGSSANTAQPLYYLSFATGPVTITNNATSLVLPSNAGTMAFNSGDSAIAIYAGSGNWRIQTVVQAQSINSVAGFANGLIITNNAGTPTTQLDISSTAAQVVTAFGYPYSVPALSVTLNAATTGANALDTGSLANNTWYHVYIIATGSGAGATLLSTSATAPTMPTGYAYKYRVGAVRTGGAATFLRTIQKGNTTSYQVVAGSTTPNMPIVVTGVTGSVTVPTYTTFSMANFVPPTAVKVRGGALSVAGIAIGAPNAAYGPHSTLTNPPPLYVNTAMNAWFEFVLETQNIFYAANNASTVLWVAGWVDAVNAN